MTELKTIVELYGDDNRRPEVMETAGEILKKGGLVAFPTETVMMTFTAMILCSQFSKTKNQRFTAGRSKTWCQNCFHLFAAFMLRQIFLCFQQGILCFLKQKLR